MGNNRGSDKERSNDTWDEVILKEWTRQYVNKEKQLKSTIINLYNMTWSQCSNLMQNRFRPKKDFIAIENNTNVTKLLKTIKLISHKFEAHISI